MVSYETTISLLDICQQNANPTTKVNSANNNAVGQQGSPNEHLQATCAMAIGHVFYLVLTAHNTEDSYNSTLFPSTGTSSPNKSNSLRGAASSAKTGSTASSSSANNSGIDPFQSPIVVSSAKFVAKVLERSNLQSILEVLHDGSTRLQQAYLTWISMILVVPFTNSDGISILQTLELYHRKGKSAAVNQQLIQSLMVNQPQWIQMGYNVDSNHLLTIYNSFTALRSFFLRVHSILIPALFRLIEQSSLVVIRGKALLALQALCLHMPSSVVSTLPERRFTTILLRVLEPCLSVLPGAEGQPPQQPAPTYIMKVALSSIVLLRNLAHKSMVEIANYLTELGNISIEQVSSMLYQYDAGFGGGSGGPTTEVRSVSSVGGKHSVSGSGICNSSGRAVSPNKGGTTSRGGNSFAASSPQKKSSLQMNTKSPSTPNHPPTTQTTTSMPENVNAKALSFAPSQLKQASELLRGVLSLLSQPTLSRLVICREDLVLALTRALQELPKARSTIVSYPKKAIYDDLKESVIVAEQACLAIVESISQIEISEPDLIQFSQGLMSNENRESSNIMQAVLNLNYASYIQYCVTSLIPSVSQLLSHPDNDLRAIVINMLRHILPYYLRQYIHLHEITHGHDVAFDERQKTYALTTEEEQLYSTVSICLQGILAHISNLLTDESPIPQYMIRLVVETMQINSIVANKVVTLLKPTGGLNILIHLLKVMATNGSVPPSAGSEKSNGVGGIVAANGVGHDNISNIDPQLLMLLRIICDTAILPVSNGTAAGIVSTSLITTGAHLLIECDISNSLHAAMVTTVFSLISYPFGLTTALQQPGNEQDIMVLLIDLSYSILHFVLKQISQAVDGNSSQHHHHGPNRHLVAQQLRKLISPLQSISSALLMLVGYCDYFIANYPYGSGNMQNDGVEDRDNQNDEVHQNLTSHQHLLDSGTRCLGMLFDLFPDVLTSQLLSRQSIVPNNQTENNNSSPQRYQHQPQSSVTIPARLILAKLLKNRRVDSRVVMKVLKILLGVTKVSQIIASFVEFEIDPFSQFILFKVSMHGGAADRAKDVLNSEPMASALQVNAMMLQSMAGQVVDSTHQAQYELLQGIGRIASQIIEIASRL